MARARQHTQEQSGFGARLRHHRSIVGLSQEALAERAGLSSRAISDLERGVKTRPHPATMRALADALGLDHTERAALATSSRPRNTIASSSPTSTTLPIPVTSIVGRHEEHAQATELLLSGSSRLLTLVGPGGVGKTRLAIEIARDIASRFADGAVFIDLAAVKDSALVAATFAAALDLRESPQHTTAEKILSHLHDTQLLLVVDNCEHVLAGVRPLVSDILGVAVSIKILATSRSPLRLRGEQTLPIAPLALPAAHLPDDIATIASTPAIDLFVQRARSVRPDFALTESNAAEISNICRKLDGLPLAIELAASRTRLLSPTRLDGLLGQRLKLLTDGPMDAPNRHRTMRATIAWSHDLLSPPQRTMFQRLAVFAGGATLEAATKISGDDDPFQVFATLEALVDLGLVMAHMSSHDEPRFRMLETVREYAGECLDTSGDANDTYRLQAAYLLDLAERTLPAVFGPTPGTALDMLESEQDNVRVALAWSLGELDHEGDPAIALKLAAALYQFWHMRGHLQEGHRWLERAVARGERADPRIRADALNTLANIANNLEDHERARHLYQASLQLNTTLGNDKGVAAAHVGLGLVAINEGAYPLAREHLDIGIDAYRSTGSPADAIPCFYARARLGASSGNFDEAERDLQEARQLCDERNIGFLTYLSFEQAQLERYRGNHAAASGIAEQCLVRFREMGERRAEAATLAELGRLALLAGALDLAVNRLQSAAEIHLEMRDEFGVVRCLEGLSLAAEQVANYPLAARLAGASQAWRVRTNTVPPTTEQHVIRDLHATLRDALGPDSAKTCFGEGEMMGLEQAIEYSSCLIVATSSGISSTTVDDPPQGPRSARARPAHPQPS